IEELAARTADLGFALRERLTIYPEYVKRGEPWLDPRLVPHVRALVDPATGLADEDAAVEGRPWQEPEAVLSASGRTDLHIAIDVEGRTEDRRGDFDAVYGDWDELRESVEAERGRERDAAGIGIGTGASGVGAGASAPHRLDG